MDQEEDYLNTYRDTYIDEVVHNRFPYMTDNEKLEVMRDIWEYFDLLIKRISEMT